MIPPILDTFQWRLRRVGKNDIIEVKQAYSPLSEGISQRARFAGFREMITVMSEELSRDEFAALPLAEQIETLGRELKRGDQRQLLPNVLG